ncbi:MAG: hypothetical protein DKINENOH_03380 [bacterium]|nr:hypothetical protein [bacterium]
MVLRVRTCRARSSRGEFDGGPVIAENHAARERLSTPTGNLTSKAAKMQTSGGELVNLAVSKSADFFVEIGIRRHGQGRSLHTTKYGNRLVFRER